MAKLEVKAEIFNPNGFSHHVGYFETEAKAKAWVKEGSWPEGHQAVITAPTTYLSRVLSGFASAWRRR